jgi:hypothetical protein
MTGGHGPAISRLRGQQLARQELARSIYRPSLVSRWWHDVTHWLGSLLSASSAGSPSWWGLILLAVAVAAAIAGVIYWLGPTRMNRRAGAGAGAVLDAAPRSAGDYRDAAEQLAASGNFGEAIIERTRAIVVDLEARDVLLRRPARTAMELATEAAAAFPAEAAELTGAAQRFDDVRYGGRTGTEAGYRRIRDLDVRLRATAATLPESPRHVAAWPASAPTGTAAAVGDHPAGRAQ